MTAKPVGGKSFNDLGKTLTDLRSFQKSEDF